ncbi:MAG: hypothetical protein AAGI17_09255 [Planctomycetota bacterium]
MTSISRTALQGVEIPRVQAGPPLADAWRVATHASVYAQVAGAAFAEAADDGLRWAEDDFGRAVRGVGVGKDGVYAAFKFEGMELALMRPDGRTVASTVLRGVACDDAYRWMAAQCEQAFGAAKRDLPAYAPPTIFALDAVPKALNDLADLLDASREILEKARQADELCGEIELKDRAPRMAVELAPGEVRSAAIAFGFHGDGWFARAETADEAIDFEGLMAKLKVGEWIADAASSVPTAFLPVESLAEADSAAGRGEMVANFLGSAVNGLALVLGERGSERDD